MEVILPQKVRKQAIKRYFKNTSRMLSQNEIRSINIYMFLFSLSLNVEFLFSLCYAYIMPKIPLDILVSSRQLSD